MARCLFARAGDCPSLFPWKQSIDFFLAKVCTFFVCCACKMTCFCSLDTVSSLSIPTKVSTKLLLMNADQDKIYIIKRCQLLRAPGESCGNSNRRSWVYFWVRTHQLCWAESNAIRLSSSTGKLERKVSDSNLICLKYCHARIKIRLQDADAVSSNTQSPYIWRQEYKKRNCSRDWPANRHTSLPCPMKRYGFARMFLLTAIHWKIKSWNGIHKRYVPFRLSTLMITTQSRAEKKSKSLR